MRLTVRCPVCNFRPDSIHIDSDDGEIYVMCTHNETCDDYDSPSYGREISVTRRYSILEMDIDIE